MAKAKLHAYSGKPSIETYYGKEDAGKIVYEERTDLQEAINKYLDLIDDLKKSEEIQAALIPALQEIQYQIESLRYSDSPPEVIKKKLAQYSKVPLGEGKFMHLSAFLTSTGEQKVFSQKEYLEQVARMIQNTKSNLTNLLLFKESDEHLMALAEELGVLEGNQDYDEVRKHMDHLTMNGIIKHYNQIKLEFLQNWLAPFQSQLAQPIATMTPQEMQEALNKVENLKQQELLEIGMTLKPELSNDFRPYNKTMHPLMNGENLNFWGFPEYRDEFLELIKKVINRFSFKLEHHYLIFQSTDKQWAYLLGFPDMVYEEKRKMRDGRVGFVPHLKVFAVNQEGGYQELAQGDLKAADYFRTLKTAVVPFLVSISVIVGTPLSEGFKESFDMWL